MVRDGRIDTLIVAITDMQGRLMGKRVQAQAFLDGVIDHGAHFCTYLLGTDMEMNTPEGFAPDELGDRLRRLDRRRRSGTRCASCRGSRRRRSSSATRSPRRPRGDPGLAADDPQAPGRRRPPSWASPSRPARSSSTTSCETAGRTSARKGWGIARAVRLLQRGLPPAPGDEGRAAPPAAAQPDDRGPDPDRVQQGRGGAGPARGQHPLRPRPRVGRPERALQARREGDRLPQRLGHHVHGQARPHLDGLVGPPPHERLGRGRLDAR